MGRTRVRGRRGGGPLSPTSCSYYFREALAGAARRGVDTDAVLEKVGLGAEQIEDLDWRGDLADLAEIVRLVVEALEDEFMGYTAERCKPGVFALMVNCVIVEASLEQAIRKGVLFYSLFTDAIEMSFESDERGGTWCVRLTRPDLDPAHYFLEFWLSIWFRLWGWLADRPPPLRSVELGHVPGPDNRGELGLLFGRAPIVGAGATTLRFDRDFLSRPVVRTRRDLKEFLATTPLGVMTPIPDRSGLAPRVTSLIRGPRHGPVEFPTFAKVAAMLYLTEQTLRRRLQAESTSYRAIKQGIRQEVAERLLRETALPIHEVSRRAGYSESRAFTRAFLAWTGSTPASYRRDGNG